MVIVDYILLGAFLVSIGVGFFRGFFKEAMSLITWVVALWVAWRFSGILDPLLASVTSPALKLWAGRVIMFVAVMLAGALVSKLLVMLITSTGLTSTDRVLGMVFGAGRGVLVVGLLVILFQTLELDREPWWAESLIVPRTAELTATLRGYLDAGLDELGEILAE
ncbi:CvpA family protein [Thioalkalivibrio sp. XN8]|uniref:CvpA family protein n=1 Tax=Thioalkalivibrio sp. XN8 TaxID=2712863 RepID=UPI0013EC1E69|nr:CvpA family protein [Thioalkalivibrio sp. XN8]NGP52448.1 CvpA family protein [Thioalkalivibrio sp. XN8]